MNGPLRPTQPPMDQLRLALVATSDQLRAVANTMTMSQGPGDTAREMIRLGPLVTDLAHALAEMDRWQQARARGIGS